MKIGMRTPSPTRSLKAKTTGRLKRAAKRSINPVYGHKGIGYLKDPERAVKNHIYHKVTVDPLEPMKDAEMPGIDIPEPRKQPTAMQGLLSIICLGSFLYVLFMLVGYRQLHLRPLVVFLVSLLIIFIIDKVSK